MTINRAIKRIRQARGFTLDELAARADLTKGYLSKIENGKRSPPVSTLQNLAIALGVDISELLDGDAEHKSVADGLDMVCRSGSEHQSEKEVSTEAGYTYKPLVGDLKNKYMSPFLMTISKGRTGVFSHDSEEFGYVVQGQVRFEYEGSSHIFRQGDSFYFDSRKSHQMINEHKEPVIIVAVNFNYRRF
jgi:transcriptional regulator with XRE-family HTH domain